MMQNPIAEMFGPWFLLFYGGLIGVVLVLSWFMARKDRSAELAPMPIPSKPDPYEIAYLRGGANETTRLAIFELIRRGFLWRKVDEKKPGLSTIEPIGSDSEYAHLQQPDRGKLSDIESKVLEWFTGPKSPKSIFKKNALAKEIDSECQLIEDKLTEQSLLVNSSDRSTARQVFFAGAVFLLAVGGFKLIVALNKGLHNVGFLIAMGVIAVIVLALVCARGRLTKRGKNYVKSLQIAFGDSRRTSSANTAETSRSDDMLPLAMGIFGVTALMGTPYEDINKMFHASTVNSGSSCGASSTGGGCGSGSSCGGGDGGGGGGCGGGGCGGCGGGGCGS